MKGNGNMKNWTKEVKQYYNTIREARMNADYENTFCRRFNGVHYDTTKGQFYVSYIYKY